MFPNIIIEKDGDGFIARVEGFENLYAYAFTKEKALEELLFVVNAVIDIRKMRVKKETESLKKEKFIKSKILSDSKNNYALQV